MNTLIKAEYIKTKRTFIRNSLILAPIAVLALAIVMTGGFGLVTGAWNWWYTLIYPGTLAIITHQIINRDKKIKYHNIFLMGSNPSKSWQSKIALAIILLLAANLFMALIAILSEFVFGSEISVGASILAALMLTLTSAWMVPLHMFLSAKFNMFANVLPAVALTVVGVALFAPSKLWWAFPYAVSIRAMCPILGIMPNGLRVPQGHALEDPFILLPAAIISIALLLVLTLLTGKWFEKREEK